MRIKLFDVQVRVYEGGKQVWPPPPPIDPPPTAAGVLLGFVLLALATMGTWQFGTVATVFAFLALAAVAGAVTGLSYWVMRPKEKGGTLLALFLLGYLCLMVWIVLTLAAHW